MCHNLKTKIANTFVEGSLESSENGAFEWVFIGGDIYFCLQMRVKILTELWNMQKLPNFDYAKNAPESKKCRFLKNAVLVRKSIVIELANRVLYDAFRRPPKSRWFWCLRLKNTAFLMISALFDIDGQLWSRSQSRNGLRDISEDSYMFELRVFTIKRTSCPCPA